MDIGHPEGNDLRKDVTILQSKGNLVNIHIYKTQRKQICS